MAMIDGTVCVDYLRSQRTLRCGSRPRATKSAVKSCHQLEPYIVDTLSGPLRRNHHLLIVVPSTSLSSSNSDPVPTNSKSTQENTETTRGPIITGSRTGTVVRPPDRWDPSVN